MTYTVIHPAGRTRGADAVRPTPSCDLVNVARCARNDLACANLAHKQPRGFILGMSVTFYFDVVSVHILYLTVVKLIRGVNPVGVRSADGARAHACVHQRS